MAPGKIVDREMARHLTKLRAGLVPDDVKEDGMALQGEHKHIRSKDKSGREDIARKDHPGDYEVDK